MDDLDRPIRVDDTDAWILRRNFQVSIPDFFIELYIFHFEPPLIFDPSVISCSRPCESNDRVDIEEHCHVRTITVNNQVCKPPDKIQRDAAAESLVRHG